MKQQDEFAQVMHEFFITILRARQDLRKRVENHLIGNGYEGITLEMTQVIFCLWTMDGSGNQQEIADRVSKNKSSITSLIDNLAKREMVTREMDPNDRRNNIIRLSKKGEAFIKEFYPTVYRTYEVDKIPLSLAQVQHLTNTLKKIIEL
ncbi:MULTISPECIES: MarR family winged helix-turn-helix transcriptional regulator [Chitinophagaceae]